MALLALLFRIFGLTMPRSTFLRITFVGRGSPKRFAHLFTGVSCKRGRLRQGDSRVEAGSFELRHQRVQPAL
jgi:hypothetical protein